MIPIYLKTPDFVEPELPIYYLLAQSGAFLVRRTALFSSVTEAGGIPWLQSQESSLALHFGRIPARLMERVYGFFSWAYREWESEAIVSLFYDPARRVILADAPPQTLRRFKACGQWITEGRIEYEALSRPPHLVKLGDIHSHADMPAFFSAADDRDDSKEDGLHIVMGNLHRQPDVKASFVTGGLRFHLEPRRVLEDFQRAAPPPAEWCRRVTCTHAEGGRRLGHSGAGASSGSRAVTGGSYEDE